MFDTTTTPNWIAIDHEQVVQLLSGLVTLDRIWHNPGRVSGSACIRDSRVSNWSVAPHFFLDGTRPEPGTGTVTDPENFRQVIASAYASVKMVEAIDKVSLPFGAYATMVDGEWPDSVPGSTLPSVDTTFGDLAVDLNMRNGHAHFTGTTVTAAEVIMLRLAGYEDDSLVDVLGLSPEQLRIAEAFYASASKYVGEVYDYVPGISWTDPHISDGGWQI